MNKDELDNLLKVIEDVFKNYRAEIYEKSVDFHREVNNVYTVTDSTTRLQPVGPIQITLKYSFSLPNFHKTDKLGWTEITSYHDHLFGPIKVLSYDMD